MNFQVLYESMKLSTQPSTQADPMQKITEMLLVAKRYARMGFMAETRNVFELAREAAAL